MLVSSLLFSPFLYSRIRLMTASLIFAVVEIVNHWSILSTAVWKMFSVSYPLHKTTCSVCSSLWPHWGHLSVSLCPRMTIFQPVAEIPAKCFRMNSFLFCDRYDVAFSNDSQSTQFHSVSGIWKRLHQYFLMSVFVQCWMIFLSKFVVKMLLFIDIFHPSEAVLLWRGFGCPWIRSQCLFAILSATTFAFSQLSSSSNDLSSSWCALTFLPFHVNGEALISALILFTIWKQGVVVSDSSLPKQFRKAARLSTPWVIVPDVTPWSAHILCVVKIATWIPPSLPLYGVLSSSLKGISVAPWMPPWMSSSSKVKKPPVAHPFLHDPSPAVCPLCALTCAVNCALPSSGSARYCIAQSLLLVSMVMSLSNCPVERILAIRRVCWTDAISYFVFMCLDAIVVFWNLWSVDLVLPGVSWSHRNQKSDRQSLASSRSCCPGILVWSKCPNLEPSWNAWSIRQKGDSWMHPQIQILYCSWCSAFVYWICYAWLHGQGTDSHPCDFSCPGEWQMQHWSKYHSFSPHQLQG